MVSVILCDSFALRLDLVVLLGAETDHLAKKVIAMICLELLIDRFAICGEDTVSAVCRLRFLGFFTTDFKPARLMRPTPLTFFGHLPLALSLV